MNSRNAALAVPPAKVNRRPILHLERYKAKRLTKGMTPLTRAEEAANLAELERLYAESNAEMAQFQAQYPNRTFRPKPIKTLREIHNVINNLARQEAEEAAAEAARPRPTLGQLLAQQQAQRNQEYRREVRRAREANRHNPLAQFHRGLGQRYVASNNEENRINLSENFAGRRVRRRRENEENEENESRGGAKRKSTTTKRKSTTTKRKSTTTKRKSTTTKRKSTTRKH